MPVLHGLPVVGGLVDVLGSLVGSIGGQKIGNLLTGKPLTAAFVTGSGDDAPSSIQQMAYQIDASTSSSSPILLAQLPFALPTPGCPSSANGTNSSAPSTPIAVTMVLPIMSNSTLQVMCATYNSTPMGPSMLIAHPCWNTTGPDGQMGQEPANMSQVFAWSQDTGVVQPLFNGTAPLPVGASCAGPDSAPGAPAPPAPASTIAEGNAASPQSVTLVFTADSSIPNTTNATTALPVPVPVSPPSPDSLPIPAAIANATGTVLYGDGVPAGDSTDPTDGGDADDGSDDGSDGSLPYDDGMWHGQ